MKANPADYPLRAIFRSGNYNVVYSCATLDDLTAVLRVLRDAGGTVRIEGYNTVAQEWRDITPEV